MIENQRNSPNNIQSSTVCRLRPSKLRVCNHPSVSTDEIEDGLHECHNLVNASRKKSIKFIQTKEQTQLTVDETLDP